MKHSLLSRFQQTWSLGEQVTTLLLSGGGDSTALLMLLVESEVPFRCLHFRHGDSDFQVDSEAFCRNLCERLKVEFESVRLSVEQTGALSWEAAARELRYREVDRRGGRFLTAHTADDQAETVVMRLLDGSGLSGLAGIRPWRGEVYRPLLAFRRTELEEFLIALGQAWMSDPTNLDGNDRARLRARLMPILEEVRSGLVETLCRTASSLADDEDALREQAEQFLSVRSLEGDHWPLEELRQLGPAVRHRVFRRLWKMGAKSQARPLGGVFRECERLVTQGQDDRAVVLGSARLRTVGRHLWLEPLELPAPQEVFLALLSGPVAVGGWKIFPPGFSPNEKLAEGVAFPLATSMFDQGQDYRLRVRRPGDRFRGKDLKKLLASFPHPPWVRDRWPLLVKAEEVVKVPGFGEADSDEEGGWLQFCPAYYRWNPKG